MRIKITNANIVCIIAKYEPVLNWSDLQVFNGEYRDCDASGQWILVLRSAPSVSQSVFTITEKAPTWAFSWLKAPTLLLSHLRIY